MPTVDPSIMVTETATPDPTPTVSATPVPQNGRASYTYDGDGSMVKSVIGEVTTYYVNAGYEKKVQGTEQVVRKYYTAGGTRIAMRENGNLTWLLSDHLGSTSVTADAAGSLVSSVKYTAFGEIRSGASGTDYQYTGQRNETEIGLDYYVARFYDPMLGRFVQADTIIPEPGSNKGYDRYSYVNNNPVNLNDPSGHYQAPTEDNKGKGCVSNCFYKINIKQRPDAKFISLQVAVGFRNPVDHNGAQIGGVGGIYGSYSLDLVITDTTSALFSSEWASHPATNSTVPLEHPLALLGPRGNTIRENPYHVIGENQFITPQIGISMEFGDLWGKPFESGASAYEGPMLHIGSTVGIVGMNYMESTDPITGVENNQVIGNSMTLPISSFPPVEYHHYYTNSTMESEEFRTPSWLYSLFYSGWMSQ